MRIEYDDLRRSRPEKGLSKQSIDNPEGGLPDAPAVQHQTIKEKTARVTQIEFPEQVF